MYNEDRFSSYTHIDERFSFKTSGFFHISYRFEGGALLLVALASIWLFSFLSQAGGESKNIILLVENLIGFVFSILFPVLLFFFGTAFVLAGKRLDYTANEERFYISNKRGRPAPVLIYYKDVVSVTYRPRKCLFFADRGFDATITDNKGNVYKYPIIHTSVSKRDGPKALPFHIIEERAGLIEKPDYAGKY